MNQGIRTILAFFILSAATPFIGNSQPPPPETSEIAGFVRSALDSDPNLVKKPGFWRQAWAKHSGNISFVDGPWLRAGTSSPECFASTLKSTLQVEKTSELIRIL